MGKAKQVNYIKNYSYFQRKKELLWVGFVPTTFFSHARDLPMCTLTLGTIFNSYIPLSQHVTSNNDLTLMY